MFHVWRSCSCWMNSTIYQRHSSIGTDSFILCCLKYWIIQLSQHQGHKYIDILVNACFKQIKEPEQPGNWNGQEWHPLFHQDLPQVAQSGCVGHIHADRTWGSLWQPRLWEAEQCHQGGQSNAPDCGCDGRATSRRSLTRCVTSTVPTKSCCPVNATASEAVISGCCQSS